MKDDFVHLHLHSDLSSLDGACTVVDYVAEAAKRGMRALGLTDHGTMRGFYDLLSATSDDDAVKPVYGVEFYVCPDMHRRGLSDDEKDTIANGATGQDRKDRIKAYEEEHLVKDRWHLTAWALDDEGLKNLFRISSKAWTSGFYYKPRCLLPGQEIVTRNGIKLIEDVVVGDEVLTHKGRFRRVVKTMTREHNGDIFGVRLSGRYERTTWMTDEHPVLVRRQDGALSWVTAKDLDGGRPGTQDGANNWKSWVCLPKASSDAPRVTKVSVLPYVGEWTLSGAREGHLEHSFARRGMKPSKHYSQFPEEISLDFNFGYLLGLYAAEGWTSKNGSQVDWCFHKDETKLHARCAAVARKLTGRATIVPHPVKKSTNVRCCSTPLAKLLSALCGNGAANKHLPDFTFEAPISFQRGLLRGVEDGDGSVKDATIIFTQTSRQLAWQMRTLRAALHDDFACVTRMELPDENHNDQWRSAYSPRRELKHRHTLSDEKFVYKPISEVEKRHYRGQVYNIEVEEDHSYVSDFAMHNCDIACLTEHAAGVAVSTGCLNSPMNDLWLAGKKRRALEFADGLYAAFGDRLYLEVQPHDIRAQMEVNQVWCSRTIRERFPQAKLLATQDAHYLNREDAKHHEVLLCVGTRARITDPGRFKFDGDEFHFRTREEMEDAFRKHHGVLSTDDVRRALDNTVELAERVTAAPKIDKLRALLPAVQIPEEYGDSELRYVRSLCVAGFEWRDIRRRARIIAVAEGADESEVFGRYVKRLKYELQELHKKKFLRYFLIVRDLYEWARAQDIFCGPGRGSSAGSLVAFLLGITSADPIEHGLIFERFISPARPELPDCDMDFQDIRRGEILEYLRQKYGEDKVSQIATHGKLSGKQVLKDVSFVFGVPFSESNAVTDGIIERDPGDARAYCTVEDSIPVSKDLAAFAKRWPRVISHAVALEGFTKTLGIHAAGIVVSPVPLTDIIPLETRKRPNTDDERVTVSALDMDGVQALGLVKLDVLGLRTLTTLKMALDAIAARTGETYDMESLPLDDEETLRGFTEQDFTGVFQYDAVSARRLCEDVVFERFSDIAVMTAINRPGATRSGIAEQFVERKKAGKAVDDLTDEEVFHPKVRAITKDTLGALVYQEQLMRIFGEVAGFSPAEVERVRKIVGKREGAETMERERPAFLEGVAATTPDLDVDLANKLFNQLVASGAYQFNLSHAVCYAIVAYWSMFLKRRHPVEFTWALVSTEPDLDEIRRFAKDARRHYGIEFLPPDVSTSGDSFSIDPDPTRVAIRGSLLHCKGVGEKACSAITGAQPYASLGDLLERARPNRQAVRSLARAGALDALSPNRGWTVNAVDDDAVWADWKRKGGTLRADRDATEAATREDDWNDEERLLRSGEVNPFSFGAHPLDIVASAVARVEPIVGHFEHPGEEGFWESERHAWVAGVVANSKASQVGDYHVGEVPDDGERERMGWGQRYANATLETDGGEVRVKVDHPLFDDVHKLLDPGTPILALVRVSPKWRKLYADAVLPLHRMAAMSPDNPALTSVERAVVGGHPVLSYPWRDEEALGRAMLHPRRGRSAARATGVVVGLKVREDRKGKEMATFALLGVGPTSLWAARVVCFASAWGRVGTAVVPDALVTVEGSWGEDGAILLAREGTVTPRRRSPVAAADPAA